LPTRSVAIAPTSSLRASTRFRCSAATGQERSTPGSGAPKPDVGPLRYLAELIGTSTADLERPVRLLTLVLVAVLDPMAVALLLAAGTQAPRASSH